MEREKKSKHRSTNLSLSQWENMIFGQILFCFVFICAFDCEKFLGIHRPWRLGIQTTLEILPYLFINKSKIPFKTFFYTVCPVGGHLSMKKIGKECNFLFYCSTTIMNYEATERDRSFNAMHLAFALLYMIKSFKY